MTRTKPPFRADVVGSILRTAPLKEARAKREKGEISAAQLKPRSKTARSRRSSRSRKRSGSKLATDGEFRRSWWHFDFYGMLDGVEIYELDHGIQFQGVQTKPRSIRITGKLGFSNHPMLEHFKFLKAHTRVDAENVHPEPGDAAFPARAERRRDQGIRRPRCHLRRSGEDLSAGDPRLLRRRLPLSAIRRHRLGLSVLAGRTEEGARPRAQRRSSAAGLCPRHQSGARRQAGRHGDHHACLPRQFPLDLDFRRRLRAGRRNAARQAELRRLFPRIRHRRAPAASSRCGSCRRATRSSCSASSPPRSGKLEKKDDVKRRIEEATKFAALDQLCLSPQCGFASTEEGNVLAEEEQWAKLRMVVELADEVWR